MVNNSIATVTLVSNYTKMSGQVHIYGVPNYQSIYNASINMFQNFTNEGSLNTVVGKSTVVLNAPPATPHSFSYFAGAGILDGIYYGGVVGIDVLGPLIARDHDMLCGDGSYESCTHSCGDHSLPCIRNPEFPTQQLSYQILSISPSWGEAYFKIVTKNSGEFFIQTSDIIDYEMVAAAENWDHKFHIEIMVKDCVLCTNPLTDTGIVTIQISDVGEPPESIDTVRQVAENRGAGILLDPPLYAYDPDNGQLAYEAVGMNFPGSPFEADRSGNIITINQLSSETILFLDFEFKANFYYPIVVHDPPKFAVEGQLKINVIDRNEKPQVRLPHMPFLVEENSPINTVLGSILIFDEDYSDTHTTLLKAPTAVGIAIDNGVCTESSYFGILKNDLQPFNLTIFVGATIDYEICRSFHIISHVTDASGMSAEAALDISVLDTNDITVDNVEIIDPDFGPRTSMETAGGQIIRIRGSNFGIPGNANSLVQLYLTNEHIPYISDSASFSKLVESCQRIESLGIGNTYVDCLSPEGYGTDLRLYLKVKKIQIESYNQSEQFWVHPVNDEITVSYLPPYISRVHINKPLKTQGGEPVSLHGSNFGPKSVSFRIVVEYGPNGVGICAQDCTVVAAHTEIRCLSNVGRGTNHRWTLWIAHNSVSEPSVETTSYMKPSITKVVTSIGSLDTRGGEDIIIVGNNFGIPSTSWYGCPRTRNIAAPTLSVIYASQIPMDSIGASILNAIAYNAEECVVVVKHTQIRCKSVPGVGHGHHYKVIFSDSSSSTWSVNSTNYSEPVLLKVSGPGMSQAASTGGQEVYFDGDFFGPANLQSGSYILASYGVYPDAWVQSSLHYPPYLADCMVSLSNVRLVCLTSPGTGKNHSWRISIAGQRIRNTFFHAGTSYGPPIIYEILHESGQSFNNGKTIGAEKLFVRGQNFGLHTLKKMPYVSYSKTLRTRKGSQNSNMTENIFTGINCVVSTPHIEITCLTEPGAGSSYWLELIVDDQQSVVATTTYAIPSIISIDGPGSNQAMEDGNQVVYIHGKNFGPNRTSNTSFLESVTYGEQGYEYEAPCILVSHILIQCKTVPGCGQNLSWQVRVSGQTSLLSKTSQTSYAKPSLVDALPGEVDSVGNELVQLQGSNFGLADSSRTPVRTSIEIIYQKSFYEVDMDTSKNAAEMPLSRVVHYGLHEVAFRSPTLECIFCNPFFSARVKLKTQTGAILRSKWLNISFKDPEIKYIYVTDGKTVASRHVQVSGNNFGQRGIVTLHMENDLIDLPFIGPDGVFPSSGSYVISYSHDSIHIEFYGIVGALSVQRAGVSSSIVGFRQMSPSIIGDGSRNGLYMKSDEVVTEEEAVYYDAKGFGHLTAVCRTLGQESLPQCAFFDTVVNSKEESIFLKNVPASPVIFSTSGFSSETGTGNLLLQCKNCGAGFDAEGNIDLTITVGSTNIAITSRKTCNITHAIFRVETQALEVTCMMPPGENASEPIQLIWGGYISPPYYVGYRPPSIEKLVFHYSAHLETVSHNVTHTITNQDVDKCMLSRESTECACEFTQITCLLISHCVWDTKINLCILSSPTQGLNFSIFGKNFGNKVNYVEVYLGQMVLKVLSLTYNIKIGLHEVRAEVPPMVFHFSRAVRLEVNGQSSDRNRGNQLSSTFFIRSGPPAIHYVDLGKNTRTVGGTKIFIYGANFGRQKEDVVVSIGGQAANIILVTDEKISLLTSEGQGRGQVIFVRIRNERSNTAKKTFDYSPPRLYRLVGPSYLFPTNGFDKNGSHINVTLVGDNFGTGRNIKIYFGDKRRDILVEIMVVRHTQINFTMPPGEGANLTIFVEVSNQTGYSHNVFVTYAKPKIKSIRAGHNVEDFASIFPTSGCIVHEQTVTQNSIGTFCDVRATLRIYGENFGRHGRYLVKFINFAGVEKIGTILNSTHTTVEVILEAGFHSVSITVFSTGLSFGKFDRPSAPYKIVYDKPRLDMVVFGEDLQSATMSNTFDAQGKFKTNNKRY